MDDWQPISTCPRTPGTDDGQREVDLERFATWASEQFLTACKDRGSAHVQGWREAADYLLIAVQEYLEAQEGWHD